MLPISIIALFQRMKQKAEAKNATKSRFKNILGSKRGARLKEMFSKNRVGVMNIIP